MPYQVAVELMKNRYEVIWETKDSYVKLNRDAESFIEKLHQTLRIEKNDTDLLNLNNYINEWIEKVKRQNLLVNSYSDDEILNKILDLFEGKVGKPFDENILSEIEREGKDRYSNQIPPGYKDAKKTDVHDSYGDLFIWKEIMQYAKENTKNIIFVTHDQKEDWWNTVHGQIVGPRVELRNEFHRETGRKFHMYNMLLFLSKFSSEEEAVNKDVIDEVGLFSSVLHRSVPRTELMDYYQTLNNNDQEAAKIRFEITRLENKNRKRAKSILNTESNYRHVPRPPKIQELLDNSKSNMEKDRMRIEYLNQKLDYLTYKSALEG